MADVVSLALPFFGLILLGYLCGKFAGLPEEGLRWMNFFIVNVALPALFVQLIAPTPFEQLTNPAFVLTATSATALCFALSFGVGLLVTRGRVPESAVQGVAGSFSNIGYMGPPLMTAALGEAAVVPTALIFVFDNLFIFTIVPILVGFGAGEAGGRSGIGAAVRGALRRIATHPFNLAIALGILMAYTHWRPPAAVDTMLTFLKNAAAPCALFTLGVTVALRPLRRVAVEVPAHLLVKLVVHPLLVWVLLSWVGDFGRVWNSTAVLMAALPPALNLFVIASQYDRYVEEASAAVLLGTLASTVTLTGWLLLVLSGRVGYDLFP